MAKKNRNYINSFYSITGLISIMEKFFVLKDSFQAYISGTRGSHTISSVEGTFDPTILGTQETFVNGTGFSVFNGVPNARVELLNIATGITYKSVINFISEVVYLNNTRLSVKFSFTAPIPQGTYAIIINDGKYYNEINTDLVACYLTTGTVDLPITTWRSNPAIAPSHYVLANNSFSVGSIQNLNINQMYEACISDQFITPNKNFEIMANCDVSPFSTGDGYNLNNAYFGLTTNSSLSLVSSDILTGVVYVLDVQNSKGMYIITTADSTPIYNRYNILGRRGCKMHIKANLTTITTTITVVDIDNVTILSRTWSVARPNANLYLKAICQHQHVNATIPLQNYVNISSNFSIKTW